MGTSTTLSADGLEALLKQLDLDTPVPSFASAEILTRPLGIFKSYLAQIVSSLVECEPDAAYDAIQSTPAISIGLGDLTIILPRLKIKGLNKIDKDFTKDLLSRFPESPLYLCPIAEGIQLRMFSSPKILPRLLMRYVADRGPSYGFDTTIGLKDPAVADSGPKKIVVEFSSPNIASEFTTNHLRSTLNGAFVANIHDRLGWDVVRINYLGDWGKQVALLAVGWNKFGSEEEFAKDAIAHLLDVYSKIEELFRPELEASHKAREEKKDTAEIESQGIYAERDAFFKRLEERDEEAIALWRRFRDVYVDEYAKGYARLGIKFDEYTGESQASAESVAEVETALKERGVYEESEGSWAIDFTKHDARGLGFAVVRGRTGSTTYLLRDIAAVLDRNKKYAFDKMIYVVAGDQDAHFSRVVKVLELIGREDLAAKIQFVGFGRITAMPAQLGKAAHMLGDMIDLCTDAAKEMAAAQEEEEADLKAEVEAEPETFGITSLIAQDMSFKRSNGYALDKKKMVGLDGDTGIYLQTSYSRLSARVSAFPEDIRNGGGEEKQFDYSSLQEEKYGGLVNLTRLMAQFPDIVNAAYKTLEPSGLLGYLFRVTDEAMCSLDDEEEAAASEGPVMEGEADKGKDMDIVKATLYEDARLVLRNGMTVLGMRPVGE